MPRQLRIEYAGAVYHVMARGDRREEVMRDVQDCAAFEKLWGEVVVKTGWEVQTRVLIGNHYHAVVRTSEANLVDGMCWLQNGDELAAQLVPGFRATPGKTPPPPD